MSFLSERIITCLDPLKCSTSDFIGVKMSKQGSMGSLSRRTNDFACFTFSTLFQNQFEKKLWGKKNLATVGPSNNLENCLEWYPTMLNSACWGSSSKNVSKESRIRSKLNVFVLFKKDKKEKKRKEKKRKEGVKMDQKRKKEKTCQQQSEYGIH